MSRDPRIVAGETLAGFIIASWLVALIAGFAAGFGAAWVLL